MYATNFKKNIEVKAVMAKQNSKTAMRPLMKSVRGDITLYKNNNANVAMAGNATPTTTITTILKSKFTERKTAAQIQTNMQSVRNVNNLAVINNKKAQSEVKISNINDGDRKRAPTTTSAIASANLKMNNFNRRKDVIKKTNETNTKPVEKDVTRVQQADIAIQTHEQEIINHDLLIGDIKFLLPSRLLIANIERKRLEAKKQMLLKAERKFEQHAERQEEHLTDLKEFLEKATITRRPRRTRNLNGVDKKLINSMDEILSKEVPCAESIADIKERIMRKEQELLRLFDNVENVQITNNKN